MHVARSVTEPGRKREAFSGGGTPVNIQSYSHAKEERKHGAGGVKGKTHKDYHT